MTSVTLVSVAALMAVSLGACGQDSDDRAGAPETTTAGPTTTESLAMDWTAPFETRLPNGWVVRECEGDRLNVCVYDGMDFLGDIELNPGYPLASEDVGQDPQEVARKLAGDMITHFRADRAEGCAAFSFAPDPVRDVTVGGQPGAKGGFILTDGNGQAVERVINYYVVLEDSYAIINADAYADEGGCLGPTEYDPTFAPGDIAELQPYLDQLVAAAGPPSVTAGK